MIASRPTAKHRYRKVALRMWGDDRFARLSALPPSGQSLWLYLLACPLPDNIPGVYRTGRASLSEDLGWGIDEFDRCFEEIAALGMSKADWKSKLLWLPNAAKYNPPESPSVVVFWSKAWAEIPECAMKIEIYQSLKAHICAIGRGFADAFEQNFAPPAPPSVGGAKQAAGQACEQPVPQPAAQPALKAGIQADAEPATQTDTQADEHHVEQPEKPSKSAADQPDGQPDPQAPRQGVPHLELELEQELEQCGDKGGVGERSSAGPSPSAPAQQKNTLGLDSKTTDAPQGQQGVIEGTDWQASMDDDDVRDTTRENQTERGTRLPADYTVSEHWLLQARKVRPDLSAEQIASAAASFVGHWSAKPGKDGLKLNWFSAWLNWVRKERVWTAAGQSRAEQPRLLPPSSTAGTSDSERERKMRDFQARYPGATFVNRPAKPGG